MDSLIIGILAAFGGFVIGVLFSKQVLGEAAALKQHVTSEISSAEARLRAELQKLTGKL